jgi:translation initiation factor 2 alpha subunit (eIF-2alpha)
MDLKEDEIVLCKVKKIEGTAVFLEIEEAEVEGHMVLSEVAAGRIRNLRQYVSPGRLVVCKVLKINPDHIELSLRRVTAKERDAALDLYKKEKAFRSVLKFVGEDVDKVVSKIKSEQNLAEFFSEIRDDPGALEDYMSKENARKVFEVLSEKGTSEKAVAKNIKIRSDGENGVEDIKAILDVGAEIHYLGGGRFSVKVSGKDFKDANIKMQNLIEIIEKKSKEKRAVLEFEKEK